MPESSQNHVRAFGVRIGREDYQALRHALVYVYCILCGMALLLLFIAMARFVCWR